MSSEGNKPTVFVVGDAGTDTLITPDKREITLAAGVPFITTILQTMLEDKLEVRSLVAEATSVASGLPVPPLKHRAELFKSPYDQRWRIASYAPSRPTGKSAKYVLDIGNQNPRPESILVAHHVEQAETPWKPTAPQECIALVEKFTKGEDHREGRLGKYRFPKVLVNVSSGLPEVTRDCGAKHDEPFASELWNGLFKHRERVGIVTSMSALRAAGAVVSRRLSLEHLVEDFCSELHLFPRLSVLGHFSHLFVRIGMVGVVHVRRVYDRQEVCHDSFAGDVYFSAAASQGVHRDSEQEGATIGKNAVLIAALLHALEGKRAPRRKKSSDASSDEYSSVEMRDLVRGACQGALLGMKLMDDAGFDVAEPESVVKKLATSASGGLLDAKTNAESSEEAKTRDAYERTTFGCRPIPAHLFAALPPNAARTSQPWHILDDVLMEAPVHRVNVAMAIAIAGHEQVFNRKWTRPAAGADELEHRLWRLLTRVEYWNPADRAPDFVTLQERQEPAMPRWLGNTPPSTGAVIGHIEEAIELSVPVMRFGELYLVERGEIESLRSITNLIRLHRQQADALAKIGKMAKPISIAVFGPPGTGKSYAVKQLARAVEKDQELLPEMEFNVAQFNRLEDLDDAFGAVSSKAVDARRSGSRYKNEKIVTPLVFFDEFDCSVDDTELSWLKYFLAPMQDGRQRRPSTVEDRESGEPIRRDTKDIGPAIFVFAGGVRHGFNQFDPRTDSAYDNLRDSEVYKDRVKKFTAQKGPDFISRLRGHIDVLPINDLPGRPKHFIRRAMQLRSFLKPKDPKDGIEAKIDPALVYALLTVDRFRHGVRSMQAIVEMCTPIHGRVEIASLPPRAQLEMHVDSAEFMVRVHRGRARSQAEYAPLATREFDVALRVLKRHIEEVKSIRPNAAAMLDALKEAAELRRPSGE